MKPFSQWNSNVEIKSTLKKIHLCQTPSFPLYHLYVIVPTECRDNRGLAHTLEHLIFIGSKSYPKRGYLDRLATLCWSNGTNAYTCEDHTCYTVTSASLDGLKTLIPVFLDHILNPLLEESAIADEVFKIERGDDFENSIIDKDDSIYDDDIDKDDNSYDDDADKDNKNHHDDKDAFSPLVGKGVVYCEMKGRQYSEGDMMDHRIRWFMNSKDKGNLNFPFTDTSTYKWECGGMIEEICLIKPEDIRDYHSKFYNPDNISILITGPKVFNEGLEEIPMQKHDSYKKEIIDEGNQKSPLKYTSNLTLERVGYFPSRDDSLGSLGMSWYGPNSSDIESITVLHVLMRALSESSSSPLYQKFIEIDSPICSDIDYEIKVQGKFDSDDENWNENDDQEGMKTDKISKDGITIITLIFSGIKADGEYLVEEKRLWNELRETLLSLCNVKETIDDQDIKRNIQTKDGKVIDNLKIPIKVSLESFESKLKEQIEEQPAELIAYSIISEIIRQPTVPIASSLSILPSLIKEMKEEYSLEKWNNILTNYLIEKEPVIIRLFPSTTLQDDLHDLEQKRLQSIMDERMNQNEAIKSLEPEIIKQNDEGNVMEETKETKEMENDSIQSILNITIKEKDYWHNDLKINLYKDKRDNLYQFIQNESSNFTHLIWCMDMKQYINSSLWPLLVLFQESIFNSDLLFDDNNFKKEMEKCSILSIMMEQENKSHHPSTLSSLESSNLMTIIPYQSLQNTLNTILTLFDCSIGFENDTFSCSYLDNYLVWSASFANDKTMAKDVISCFKIILRYSNFTESRLKTIIENLLIQLSESMKDPNVLADASYNLLLGQYNESFKRDQIEYSLNIHIQKQILDDCKKDIKGTIESLNQIRMNILDASSFTQIATCSPCSSFSPLVNECEWKEEEMNVNGKNDSPSPFKKCFSLEGKMKKAREGENENENNEKIKNFIENPLLKIVIPRSLGWNNYTSGGVKLVSSGDATASHLSCSIKVSEEMIKNTQIKASLSLLCYLLSYTEGPLYSLIRGLGLAYGTNLILSQWDGLLTFNLMECLDPAHAFFLFIEKFINNPSFCDYSSYPMVDNVASLEDSISFSKKSGTIPHISRENLAIAKSNFMHDWIASRSTPSNQALTIMRNTFKGYTLKDDDLYLEHVHNCQLEDIEKVYREIMGKFMIDRERMTIVVVPSLKILEIKNNFESRNIKVTIDNSIEQNIKI